jgi:transportin-1
MQGLFALAHDNANTVRKEVCAGLVQLLSIQPDRLSPYLYQVIEYMLASNEHADQEVALESCEFWSCFCDAELDPELLRPFLPRLIPMLMKNMVGL